LPIISKSPSLFVRTFFYIYFFKPKIKLNIKNLHALFLECRSVSTDTRKIKKGDLFFALKGDNFNGNTYAEEALKLGAKYAVIDDAQFHAIPNTILVNNTLETLQELAPSFKRSEEHTSELQSRENLVC